MSNQISVIMATYNCEKIVAKTINSVLAQTDLVARMDGDDWSMPDCF